MKTAFVLGNGESRKIFPIELLKGKGTIWGCNAIFRDKPDLCDHIVAVNQPMYDELKTWHRRYPGKCFIHGPNDIHDWNYKLPGDTEYYTPPGLKLYRIWRGGDIKKGTGIRTIDFTESRGSGASAVLLAAESGVKNICVIAFDILGARQWEFIRAGTGEVSMLQNNIYKNTINYPSRINMKAYLKYEWMFQLRQIFRKYPTTNFYFFNRRENIEFNHYLKGYFDTKNIRVGTYGDLKRWIDGEQASIDWWKL